ncbi:MAG: serine/threonine protein kinase [bacterium]|nr:serine/threonine protein kinase [bacterium]
MTDSRPADRCDACGCAVSPDGPLAGSCPRCLAGLAIPEEPRTIGPYRILDLLGEGGMGEVYLAEQQEPIRRQVALKRIKPWTGRRGVLARFDCEREMLARLSHPDIARIHDAGTDGDGRPYFVMEYIDGVPITEHCDQHRRTLRERIELFLEVCAAIDHAHRRSILHRDLKPSNILVTYDGGRARPKVIDFGVAMAIGDANDVAGGAARGPLAGTPEYMSPEQASPQAAVDARSDVYGLGVVLYELLVGVVPLDLAQARGSGKEQVRRAIREVEPERPSERLRQLPIPTQEEIANDRQTTRFVLARQLRGDLESIVLRVLSKRPEERYATPAALADDLGRFLDGRTVRARSAGALYRGWKFAGRHRTLVAATVLVIVALGLGAVQATLGWRTAKTNERDAQDVAHLMMSLLRTVDPATGEGHSLTARDLLAVSAERAETLDGQPALRTEFLVAIGEAYARLGEHPEARRLVGRALELDRELLGPDHPKVASRLESLGEVLLRAGDYGPATELFEQARGIRASADDLDTSATLGLAEAAGRSGQLERAQQLYGEALRGLRRIRGEDDPEVMRTLENLAGVHAANRSFDAAEALYHRVLAYHDEDETHGRSRSSGALNGLAMVYLEQSAYDRALPLVEQALTIDRERYGPDHVAVGNDLSNLGLLLVKLGRLREARPVLERSLEIRGRALGPTHADLATTLGHLGAVYQRTGDNESARAVFERALEIRRHALGPRHPDTARAMCNVAIAYEALGQWGRARELYLQALDIQESAEPVGRFVAARTLEHLARLFRREGRLEEARRLLERSLALNLEHFGENTLEIARTLHDRAILHLDGGELELAESDLLRVLDIRERILGGEHLEVSEALRDLATVYELSNESDRARELRARATELRVAAIGGDHTDAEDCGTDNGSSPCDDTR